MIRIGKVTSNDGALAIIQLVESSELIKIHRSKIQTEDYFLLLWAVGKDVTIG